MSGGIWMGSEGGWSGRGYEPGLLIGSLLGFDQDNVGIGSLESDVFWDLRVGEGGYA